MATAGPKLRAGFIDAPVIRILDASTKIDIQTRDATIFRTLSKYKYRHQIEMYIAARKLAIHRQT